MKNKEKYAEEIINIACNGNSIAVIKESGCIASCGRTCCVECLFNSDKCKERVREWAESEYIEKPVISKSDRAFLDYLREEYKFVVRDEDDKLFVYSSKPYSKPYKDKNSKCWCAYDCINNRLILNYNVDFPMVKWSDKEPWKIDDLKRLEVVEEYG
jgi:hypothetical protein